MLIGTKKKKRESSVAGRVATIQLLWHVLFMLVKLGRWSGIPLLNCYLWHVAIVAGLDTLAHATHPSWWTVPISGGLMAGWSIPSTAIFSSNVILENEGQPHGGWRNAKGSIIASWYVTFLDAMNGNKPCFGEATLRRPSFHQKLSLHPCKT